MKHNILPAVEANVDLAPEQVIENLMYGFMASSVLFAGDELGIFDYMAKNRSTDLETIAAATSTSKSALERLFIAGTCIGLLNKSDARNYRLADGMYKLLDKDSPQYCGNSFGHYYKTTAPLFQFLPSAIKENAPQWHKLFPDKAVQGSPFDAVYASPDDTAIFLESMWGLGYSASQELLQDFSMSAFKQLTDLGGATGSFVIAALENNPYLKGTVFDLEVVGPYFKAKREKHRLTDRLEFIVGDIFKDDFPKSDCYSLGYILSDWSREQGTRLLKKVYDALPSGGAVIVLEKLFNERKDGPISTAMMNLVMLLEMYGTHYSVSEYKEWLESVGYVKVKSYLSSGEKHMVVAYKP